MMTLRKGLVLGSIAFAAGCSDATTSTTFADGTVSKAPVSDREDPCAPIEGSNQGVSTLYFGDEEPPPTTGGTIVPGRYVKQHEFRRGSGSGQSGQNSMVLQFGPTTFTQQSENWKTGETVRLGGTWSASRGKIELTFSCMSVPMSPAGMDVLEAPRPFAISDTTLVIAFAGNPKRPSDFAYSHFERED